MRARELLDENYQQNLESDLGNLLIGAKGNGATDIPTDQVVQQLNGMGYSVDANSLMLVLSRNPAVLNATPQAIQLTQPGGTGDGGNQGQDSAAKVSDMASKATKIG